MRKITFLVLAALVGFMPGASAQKKKSVAANGEVVIYFARHGKTILNTMDRVQGWADTPLTPAGVEVAEYLGEGLQSENIQFKAAYSSDLGRARQTARIVLDNKGQANLPITEVAQLRETNFGSYEGDLNGKMWGDAALYLHYKSAQELFADMEQKPELLKSAIASFKALETLGIGEDYDQVKARGQKAIREIAAKEAANGGGNILIVGHGMSIGVFLSDIDSNGKKPSANHMGNAAVCKVIYKDGKFSLESFGDMSYVEKGKSTRTNK
ncbi:histidine phosphatase family protein [Bacteroides reticulotermitis]|uniref:Phosphoglycerate mutase family n=3 Tax=Bacteroides reticulotermitis TaxID=1133319 RepID=W4UW89_9BACE|nr:histidine phosphatase family protein [Bacteroides reticulotermitis]MBB4042855.1 putative phosphoglycerate mutase [Bacteroides reticulotermitis]GAE85082.1 phosphoglycerate mutase family [Bacteroides reticulotermitis JCM 10512]